MAVNIVSPIQYTTDTLAHFNALSKPLSDMLATIGWTKASDGGMIDWTNNTLIPAFDVNTITYLQWRYRGAWSSVTTYAIGDVVTLSNTTYYARVSTTNSSPNGLVNVANWSPVAYEIWKSSDALSSSIPIYVKIEWYAGAGGNANSPGMFVTFGTGSDGNGNLTGSIGTRQRLFGSNTTDTTTVMEFDLSGGTNWFCFLLFRQASGSDKTAFISCGRSRDSSGNVDNRYIITWLQGMVGGGGNGCKFQIVQNPLNGGALPVEGMIPTVLTGQTSGAIGGNVALGPIMPVYGKLDNPILEFAAAKAPDITEGATISASLYGTTHTFLCTKASVLGANLNIGNTTGNSPALLFRWE